MFTGIVEGLGTIVRIQSQGQGKQLTIAADFDLHGTSIGSSIAVNGACLTAVTLEGKRFAVDLTPETLVKTTFGDIKVGDRVNLERAMRLSDRLDGHLVSGHIDGIGRLEKQETLANAVILTLSASENLTRYMIKKGSIAIDGISLTINDCGLNHFQVSIIPHTAQMTTIGIKKTGDALNLETDLIGKWVERFITSGQAPAQAPPGGIDMALLTKSGFIK